MKVRKHTFYSLWQSCIQLALLYFFRFEAESFLIFYFLFLDGELTAPKWWESAVCKESFPINIVFNLFLHFVKIFDVHSPSDFKKSSWSHFLLKNLPTLKVCKRFSLSFSAEIKIEMTTNSKCFILSLGISN